MWSRILKANVAYAVGSAANSATLLLLVPFFVNNLSPAEYGTWVLCEIGIVLMIMVILAGMDVGLMREYWFLQDDLERRRLTGTVLTAVSVWGIGMIAVLGVALWFLQGQPIITRMGLHSNTLVLVLAIGCAEAIFNLLLTLLRIREQVGRFLALSIGRMLLFVVAAIAGVQLGGGMNGALTGRLLAGMLGIGVAIIWARDSISPTFVLPQFRRVLRYGMPLLPASLASYVLFASDRFVLERFSTLEIVGIYSLAYKIATTLDVLVIRPFALDWAPRRFKIATQPGADRKYAEILVLYLFVAVVFALLVIATTPTIYAWIAPARYAEGMGTVAIILAAYLIYGLSYPLNVGIMLKDRTGYVPIISWIAAIVCMALNLWLIPRYTIFGAAWATLASYVVYAGGIGWMSLRLYPIRYSPYALVLIGMGLLLGYGGVWEIERMWATSAEVLPMLIKVAWVLLVFAGIGYLLWGGGKPLSSFGHRHAPAVSSER
jgi:O-antigen/teichoic acid export membrane protein